MTITDIDISTFEDLVVDQEPPCEPCQLGAAEWIVRVRKHEHCDDGNPHVFLMCVKCKNLALDPETLVSCSVCDETRPLPPYITSIDPL